MNNVKDQISQVDSVYNASLRKLSESYEENSNKVFDDANTKLETLKADMLYRFDRIEKTDGKKTYHTLIERKDQADIVRMVFNWYCN